jgi:hypothetical protein
MSFIGKSPKANRLRLQPLSADPVSPAEGDLQYADGSAREEGLWVFKNAQWTLVSQPVENVVLNPDIENGTPNYSLFNTTITSFLPTGTINAGAAATLSAVSVNPLQGVKSLQFTTSGAISAGQGFITDVFSIERGNLGQKFNINFQYEVVSGASNAQWSSGLGAQTFIVYLWNQDTSSWVQPLGFLGLNNTTAPAQFTANVRLNSANYRLAVLASLPTTGTVSVNFDSFSVTPIAPDLDVVSTAVNTSGTIISSGVWTQIGSWTSTKDTSLAFSPGDGRFETLVFGSYAVSGLISFTSNAAGERGIRVVQDGATVMEMLFPASSAGVTALPFSTIVNSTLRSQITLQIFQNSGVGISIVPSPTYNIWNVVRVSD